MFTRRSDLPLDRDPGARFLPWIVAFMVFLAALSLMVTVILHALGDRWDQGVSGTLTVQVMPLDDADQDATRLSEVVAYLKGQTGVVSATPVPRDEMVQLLEPWLGSAPDDANFPLPHLIDVTLAVVNDLDLEGVAEGLNNLAPGTTLDDHRVWLDQIVKLSQVLVMAGSIVLALILSAMTGTVFFTTRTGLAIHHDVIEVLHLIGAQDDYIARQFGSHAMALGLKGGLIGLAVALPTLGGLGYLYLSLDSSLLPDLTINSWHWALLPILPLIAGLVARFTARATVMRTLRKMV